MLEILFATAREARQRKNQCYLHIILFALSAEFRGEKHFWYSTKAKKMPAALILQGQIPFIALQRRDFSPAALILQGKIVFNSSPKAKISPAALILQGKILFNSSPKAKNSPAALT